MFKRETIINSAIREETVYINGDLKFFVANMKGEYDPIMETALWHIDKKDYNIGIILNKPDQNSILDIMTIPCYSSKNNENYHILKINSLISDLNMTTYKFIFVNTFSLFSRIINDNSDCDFFEWLKTQIHEQNNHKLFLVSDYDPFFFFRLRHTNTYLIKFIDIITQHEHINKILYISSHDDDGLSGHILPIMWPNFYEKIKMLKLGGLKTTETLNEPVMHFTPKEKIIHTNIEKPNNYDGYLHIDFSSKKNDHFIYYNTITMQDVIKFITNRIIRIMDDIKTNGYAHKKMIFLKWYEHFVTNINCNQMYKQMFKSAKILPNVLRKNFITSIINKIEKMNDSYQV